ncbi:iron uptake protein [Roseateles sp. BYS180W]|uniref:Iron uptake protein n=1 Tax=Roseateles rivi TaxID=3299028 RepID=A0ABW7FYH9_9BURK
MHIKEIVSRTAAALLGSYIACWGLAAFGIALAVTLGADFEDAQAVAAMLVFLVFLCGFLWAFGTQRLAAVWRVQMGLGLVLTVLAQWLQQRLV